LPGPTTFGGLPLYRTPFIIHTTPPKSNPTPCETRHTSSSPTNALSHPTPHQHPNHHIKPRTRHARPPKHENLRSQTQQKPGAPQTRKHQC